MSNRKRTATQPAIVTDVPNSIQEEITMQTETPTVNGTATIAGTQPAIAQPQPAIANGNQEEGSPEEEGNETKLTSFNVTTSVLRRLPNGGFRFVLSFRPTVRGSEFWLAMKESVNKHVPNPKSFDKTDDHVYVESVGEPDVVTFWAIRRSDRRCPTCGEPTSNPTAWCNDAFCESARTATPTEKKQRRVENKDNFDI